MTEEEFKTRFDLTCFGGLLGMLVLGTLLVKGCQYSLKKIDQYSFKADESMPKVSKQLQRAPQIPPEPPYISTCFDGEEVNRETELKDIHHPVVFQSSQRNIPHIDLDRATAGKTNGVDMAVLKVQAVRKAENVQ